LLNKPYEDFVCACEAGSCSCTLISMKQSALCKLIGTCCCLIHYSTLIENLKLCSSAEAGIVLNFFLNFEQK